MLSGYANPFTLSLDATLIILIIVDHFQFLQLNLKMINHLPNDRIIIASEKLDYPKELS